VSSAIQPGSYSLGPENATLRVKTARQGAAAKVGHDLTIDVTSWSATLEVGGDGIPTAVELRADGDSLRVREGTGGVQALGDDDRVEIQERIDEEVLGRKPIEFRSTAVEPAGEGRFRIAGDLTLAGREHPSEFELGADADGAITGAAVVRQSDWGIKPYTALFGTLKVKDEVEIEFAAQTIEK